MKGFFEFGSPFIEVDVEKRKIKMLLDTGFNGHLMLPSSTIQEIGLDPIGISDYRNASGDVKITKVYLAKILFFDKNIEVPVLSNESDIFLAGMELFKECRIVIESKHNLVDITKSD